MHHLSLSLPPSLPPPSPSVRDVRLLILEHSRWSMVEKYQALMSGPTVDELMEFSRSFKAELYAEGLVQGNLSGAVSSSSDKRIDLQRQQKKIIIVVIFISSFLLLPAH